MGDHTVPLGKKLILLLSPVFVHHGIRIRDGIFFTAILGILVKGIDLPHDMVGGAGFRLSIFLGLARAKDASDVTRMSLALCRVGFLLGDVGLHLCFRWGDAIVVFVISILSIDLGVDIG